jgi:hypothetical protein
MDKNRRRNSTLFREVVAVAFAGASIVARRRPLRLSASSSRGQNSVGHQDRPGRISSRNVRSYAALTKFSGDFRLKGGLAQLTNRDRPTGIASPLVCNWFHNHRALPHSYGGGTNLGTVAPCRMSGSADPRQQGRQMSYGRPFGKRLRGISSMTGMTGMLNLNLAIATRRSTDPAEPRSSDRYRLQLNLPRDQE